MYDRPTLESLHSDLILIQHQLESVQSDMEALNERINEMETIAIAERIDRNVRLIKGLGKAVNLLGQSSGLILALVAALLFWSAASNDTRQNAADKVVGDGLVPVAIAVVGLGFQVVSRRKIAQVNSEIDKDG